MNNTKVDKDIEIIDAKICRHISDISFLDRGTVSQDVLSDLRHLVEHIMLKIYANGKDIQVTYENLCKGINYVAKRGDLKELTRFHDLLEISISHYVLNEENSERLMQKYYEYLFDLREYVQSHFNLQILSNLEEYPIDTDPKLKEYYEKIAAKIEKTTVFERCSKGDRFYIRKIKPFFVEKRKYYEVTFSAANDTNSKGDRIIAFTKHKMVSNYAVRMSFSSEKISVIGKEMPISIITGWEIAIRGCEFSNFSRIIRGKKVESGYSETQALCLYMTQNEVDLLDIIKMSPMDFAVLKAELTSRAKNVNFWEDLEQSKKIISNDLPGANILRLLLFQMNNSILKSQFAADRNQYLSDLYLDKGCIPFDRLPLNFSPKEHNPLFGTLLQCIDIKKHNIELMARHIKMNSESGGMLFTEIKELEQYGDFNELMMNYNDKLYSGHKPNSEVETIKKYAYIHGYVEDCKNIINKLRAYSSEGIQNYTNSMNAWLKENPEVDCEEKKELLCKLFSESKVGIVYGAAGTGKTTLIKHVSNFFARKKKLFLAQTNPAVDNLKRKVKVADCEYMTIAKFLSRERVASQCDVLVIDECSTVSNRDMRRILNKADFKLILLVGDVFQINSIRFGNWFNIIEFFIPKSAVYELKTPYRSNDNFLLEFWNRVRLMSEGIEEIMAKNDYSKRLDDSLFEKREKDEIILCLNYDGLYGINNINRFMQENNAGASVEWGLKIYKEGDPILFNESERFAPIIYNNMKGVIRNAKIVDVDTMQERIVFDIELDKVLNGTDAWGQDFEIIDDYDCENTVIRFAVNKLRAEDDEDDLSSSSIVPFQIAYAVSIHKAQGLEFDSVKIVITNEVEERITHNIFYTAITRARKYLKIFWSPEVQNAVLSSLKPRNCDRDASLLHLLLE